jgi:hypothetical protein
MSQFLEHLTPYNGHLITAHSGKSEGDKLFSSRHLFHRTKEI